MFTLLHARIATRLTLVLAGALALMAAIAGFGVWGVDSLFRMTEQALQRDVSLAQHAADLQALTLMERRYEKDSFFQIGQADKRADYLAKWEDAAGRLRTVLQAARGHDMPAEDQEVLNQVGQHFTAYVTGFREVSARVDEGAIGSPEDANTAMDRHKAAVRGMESAVHTINERAMARASAVLAQVEQVRDTTVRWQLALTALGMALAALSIGLVTRSITRPLHRAVAVAETVASGDLSSRIDAQGTDETGQLLGALQRMNDGLVRIVSQVRNASQSIASGSSQLAMGSSELSQRAEAQAGSLEQTAASMEQLTATVQHNAAHAEQASGLALRASQVAEEGGAVVSRVVATMDGISASSRKIADITGVIDGIAFQTNILALNAAVEAARAGEQGRGFAVVAGEVRSLAQRSAEAAGEIKALIADSVQRVEAGSRLVTDAGRTMTQIVEQVREVGGLIREISHSSGQQSAGISQVGSAVAELDRVTQQNTALAEESSAAAESLRRQADDLARLVATFRLDGVQPAAA
ncbi:methyl-accepting chemotaxis protein [Ideonella sp.]|uniref:methyl-accepting chemotaxis protein n=1 Tax=Ideonella sp. TaxID=1929293 RepID=UPI0035AEAD1D